MKSKNIIILLLLLQGCYTIDKRDFLFITFHDSKLSSSFLKQYIDTVNRQVSISDTTLEKFTKGEDLKNDERIVYFKESPEEWYLLSFDVAPCWIQYIYNKQLSKNIISKREDLSKNEIKRIESRFRDVFLKGAENYAKQNDLPDSIVYVD